MSESALLLRELLVLLRNADLLVEVHAPEELVISGVSQDSRTVGPGDLFLAWEGSRVDAHEFLPQVMEQGGAAAIVERIYPEVGLPQVQVRDGRRAAAILAHLVLGRPSEALQVVAVTGTNGKTTVTSLSRQILSRQAPAAALGTLGMVGPDGVTVPGTAGLTTPGPVELSRRLAELVAEGVASVSLEASSHALEQRRLDGIGVDVACFTNLTRDHLDYHGTQQAYLGAKGRLVHLLKDSGGGVVVNGVDPAWRELPTVPSRLLKVGLAGKELHGPRCREELPPLQAHQVRSTSRGTSLSLRQGEEEASVTLSLLGEFNVENALVAAGAALLLGRDLSEVAGALADVTAPPGRLEIIATDPVPVIRDYAHTPHALARVLETLRPLYPGRVIAVFGAGGDRDREKRPQMGRAVAHGAQIPIVTSDNPRTEDPDAIIDDIIAGMGRAPYRRVTDRREAIGLALEMAREGDVILLAGKGHETVQVVGQERREFDERVIVREILATGGSA
jgi:UDP-N-acetylmuramoyl-L-alanyl-D-glutamate--2,6-diaminopimelate ligase